MVIDSPLLNECKAAAQKDSRVHVATITERPHHVFLYDPRAKGCTPLMEIFHITRLKDGVWVDDPLALDIPEAEAIRLTCSKMPIAMAPGFCRVWVNNLSEFQNILNVIVGAA